MVEHQGRLSLRPSVVQLMYDFPRKVNGKWHTAPSALPYNVFTTCVGKRGKAENEELVFIAINEVTTRWGCSFKYGRGRCSHSII